MLARLDKVRVKVRVKMEALISAIVVVYEGHVRFEDAKSQGAGRVRGDCGVGEVRD